MKTELKSSSSQDSNKERGNLIDSLNLQMSRSRDKLSRRILPYRLGVNSNFTVKEHDYASRRRKTKRKAI